MLNGIGIGLAVKNRITGAQCRRCYVFIGSRPIETEEWNAQDQFLIVIGGFREIILNRPGNVIRSPNAPAGQRRGGAAVGAVLQ